MASSSRSRVWYRLAEAAHLTALGGWLGSLVMAGATAAIVFPAFRELEPSLPAYAGYSGPHADLAAGMIQNRVFFAADVAQFFAGVVSLVTIIALIAFLGLPLRSLSTALRTIGLGAALGLASFWLMVLAPRMQTELRAYWAAAQAGENAAASAHRAAFEDDHPLATNIMAGTAFSVFVSLSAGAFSAAGGGRVRAEGAGRSGASPGSPGSGVSGDLEEPALARRAAR